MSDVSCLALDLDFCLSHFGEANLDGLLDVFAHTGLSRDVIRAAEEEAERRRFTPEVFCDVVTEMTGHSFDRDFVIAGCWEWLQQTLRLYPDVRPWLSEHVSSELPYVIVTYGDAEFQGRKIQMLGLGPSEVYFVPKSGEKYQVIRELASHYRGKILFVDDNPLEHDNVVREGQLYRRVRTVRIRRPDSVYRDRTSEYHHQEVWSLSEISL